MTLPWCLLALPCELVTADDAADRAKAEKLRKEIAELRAKIKEKETELAKLEPAKAIEWKLGSVGSLPKAPKHYTAIRVIAPGQVIVVRTNVAGTDDGPPILLKGVSTVGVRALAPIEVFGQFKIVGELVFNGGSIWTVELQK